MEPRTSAPNSPSTPEPTVWRCTAARSFVFSVSGGPVTSELLYGESFAADHVGVDWLTGVCTHDGYPGAVRTRDFTPDCTRPSHRIVARDGLVFAEPSIKAALVARLPMGSVLDGLAPVPPVDATAAPEAGPTFVRVTTGYVHPRHIAELADPSQPRDPVVWAERMLGAPYLWGGRSGEGIDCSGLVQLALGMAGMPAPRDSGPQRHALGRSVSLDTLARGDLVFMPGHVVLMVDPVRAIHANAHWMTVAVERLGDVLARLPADTAIVARRL